MNLNFLYSANMDSYRRENGLYIHDDRLWEIDKYGYNTKSKWDVIYITCAKILYEGDKSDWAKLAVMICHVALERGYRWPILLDDPRDCNSRIAKWWGKLMYKLKLREFSPYGPVTQLTRDPVVYVNSANILMGLNLSILIPPRYLNIAPTTYFWCKYLQTKKPVYKRLYELFEGDSGKDYVVKLQKLRRAVINILHKAPKSVTNRK